MTAVIYARYSSDSQREDSIECLLRECTAFAEKNGITVLRHYIDRAFSAKTDNRPEFQNMIKNSSEHLFEMIIVWKLDGFARNRQPTCMPPSECVILHLSAKCASDFTVSPNDSNRDCRCFEESKYECLHPRYHRGEKLESSGYRHPIIH